MLKTLRWYGYFFGYLLYSLPKLIKMRKLDSALSIDERDNIIHKVPQKWARTLVSLTGSKVHVEGQENIPNGPVLFVSNHQGNFDIPVLIGYINKPMGFISKIEVKKIPLISGWMELMNCIFINRKDKRQAVRSIYDGIEKLKQGHSMVIFPEGTRSKGGPHQPFKAGGLKLAIESQVPIIPVVIDGTYKVMEQHGGKSFRPAEINAKILPAVYAQSKDAKALALQLETIIFNEGCFRKDCC